MRYILFFLFLFVQFNVQSQEYLVVNLKIQGNKKTKVSFIKKISSIKAGVVLDSLLIEEDIKRLPSIAHAYYQVFYSHENKYNVFYNIE